MSEDVVFGLLRRVPLFAGLPAADLQAAAKTVRLLSKKKAARIFEEGSAADSCYVITSGRAKVVLSGAAAAEVILGTVEPFELVGELALLATARRSAGLVAMEDCHLLRLPGASFHELRNNRAFEDKLIAHVTSMLRRATEQLRAIHTYSSTERVSWCLARLAARAGRHAGDAIVISPRPRHQQLADMTGCSRETVTRILLRMKRLKSVSWDDESLKLTHSAFKRYLEVEAASNTGAELTPII